MLSDKRVIKTRNGIKNAFMQLILNTEIGKITVSDLAEKAQINRSTFYLHYTDVNAVMKDIENEMQTEISACINNFDINNVYESIYATFTNLTDLLNEKPIMKNYILDSTSKNYLIGRIKEILVDKTIAAAHDKYPELNIDEIAYPFNFAAAGTLDTYVKWAHSDKSTSLNELIKTVSTLIQQILEYLKLV